MWLRRLSALALLAILAACHLGTHHQEKDRLHQASVRNRELITKVTLGQSFADVRGILGAPQRREAARTLRGDQETWGYLIDYDRSLMSAVIFVDGKVVEIHEASWTRAHDDD